MNEKVRIQVLEDSAEHEWKDVGNKAGDQSVPVTVASLPLPSGASTSAKQDDIIIELQKKPDEATTPTVYNVTLTNANTEYSQALPVNTKELRFRCRTLYDVRFAWVTGKVATPTEPYLTLPAGSDYWSDRNDLSSQTLFFASSTAGVVCELEVWE